MANAWGHQRSIPRAAERINEAATNTPSPREHDPAVTACQALGVPYHGAHLVRTGMEEYIAHQFAHRQGRDLHRAVPMMDRVHRCEQLLDAAVNPSPWAGSPTTERAPPQHLAETLARWDIAAPRPGRAVSDRNTDRRDR